MTSDSGTDPVACTRLARAVSEVTPLGCAVDALRGCSSARPRTSPSTSGRWSWPPRSAHHGLRTAGPAGPLILSGNVPGRFGDVMCGTPPASLSRSLGGFCLRTA
ncbi:hypothetical protein ACFWBB_37630 [Streptomyces sp. NPDC060000]|uniref:hypothetical protein n=1 Tax=Streptomyces sp. NPDC060000 TaxID=3347031 RepID=UPI0036890E62